MKSSSVTIQMKATEQYFPVLLFKLSYKVFIMPNKMSLWIKNPKV